MRNGIVFDLKNNKAVVITADGDFLSIPADISWQVGDEVSFRENKYIFFNEKIRFKDKSSLVKKTFIGAIAACLLLFIIPFTSITQASTYISIDINPSLELELKNSKVVNVTSLNEDSEEVISIVLNDVIGNDIYTATQYIIDTTRNLGYLMNEENLIVVGVYDEKAEFQLEEYENFIEESCADNNYEVEVLLVSGTEEDKQLADRKEISIGKYVIQQEKKMKGIEISDEELKSSDLIDIVEKINKDNNNSNNNSNKADDSNNSTSNNQNNKTDNNSQKNDNNNNNDKETETDNVNNSNNENNNKTDNKENLNNNADNNKQDNNSSINNSNNSSNNEKSNSSNNSNNSINDNNNINNNNNDNNNNSNNNSGNNTTSGNSNNTDNSKQTKNEPNTNSQKNK